MFIIKLVLYLLKQNNKTMYEINNYTKDYYINKKRIGYEILETPDRDVMGYTGRRLEILKCDTKFKKKLYKKGTEVYTEVSPICGKLLGTREEKIQLLYKSKQIFTK